MNINSLINQALQEDCVNRDITSQFLVDAKTKTTAVLIAKQNMCVCGLQIATQIFKKLDPSCRIQLFARDGQHIKNKQKLMTVTGNARAILAAERSALNFLQQLSGCATLTAQFVKAVKNTQAKICDTRKTIPGWRNLQKYAAVCGGAINHRFNLSDMALVKDNHWKLIKKNEQQLLSFKKKLKRVPLLIEVETPAQLQLALQARADIIMLDNLPPQKLKQAIAQIKKTAPQTKIEVSGGVTLKTVKALALLGADRISIGALTHSAPAVDISLEL